jgi:hypothetical protein
MTTQAHQHEATEVDRLKVFVKAGLLTGEEDAFEVYLFEGRYLNDVVAHIQMPGHRPYTWENHMVAIEALTPDELDALKKRVCRP